MCSGSDKNDRPWIPFLEFVDKKKVTPGMALTKSDQVPF